MIYVARSRRAETSEDFEYEYEFEDDSDTEPSSDDNNNAQPQSQEVDEELNKRKQQLQEHDFAVDILHQTGRSKTAEPYENAFSLLQNRSLAVKYNTRASCAHIGQRYIPNRQLGMVDQYDHHAFCGQFSKDGEVFVSACQDQIIRLYTTNAIQKAVDKNTLASPFKEIHARDVGWSIVDCHYSPDQNSIIYSSWSPFIHLCSIHAEDNKHEALDLRPGTRQFCAFSIRFSADSKEILVAGSDSCLYLYDIEAKRRTLKIHAHNDDVNTICYADDSSNIFFSGSDDSLCKVWDRRCFSRESLSPVGVLVGHADGITCIDSKGDGRYFISNSKDQTMKLWDIRKMKNPSEGDIPRVPAARRNWDYRWEIAPSQRARPIHPNDMSLMTYRGHRVLKTLIRCHFSPEFTTGQRYAYSGSHDGDVYIFDLLTGDIVQQLTNHSGVVRDVSWHPYAPILLSTSWDCTIGYSCYYNEGAHDILLHNWQ
eukprot:GEZU01010495.1.p1 GENE.GEZU01010495.1~~GEZU01010495.1.p1  ORF type:complete len:482 (-),score=95.84 GEZU01010495.1:147-1592(-)